MNIFGPHPDFTIETYPEASGLIRIGDRHLHTVAETLMPSGFTDEGHHHITGGPVRKIASTVGANVRAVGETDRAPAEIGRYGKPS